VLLALGVGVIIAGVAFHRDAIAVAGLATAILGVLLERLTGDVEIGLQGFKGSLISRTDLIQEVRTRSDAGRLDPDKTNRAVAEIETLLPANGVIMLKDPEPTTTGVFMTPKEAREQLMHQLADRAIEAASRDECGDCGLVLPYEFDDPERRPCPRCGSTRRSFYRTASDSISVSDQARSSTNSARHGRNRKT
jgi:hypothetical protein